MLPLVFCTLYEYMRIYSDDKRYSRKTYHSQ
nr:MAG TPA: hypothetical protein [Caudoviricetes sp.]